MDRFRTMESFVRVVHAGSFTVAAHQLGLSRALVSRHVSDLEQRLGVRLLNRSTRSLNLTEEGRTYLEFCEEVFRQIDQNERAIRRTRTEPVGTLRLAAPKSFGTMHLADAIVAFAKVQPRIRVSLLLENVSLRRSQDFVERGLDLALAIAPRRVASVQGKQIALLDWSLCASPDYLARKGRPAVPADLSRHDCLVHVNVSPHDTTWQFDGPNGPVSAKVTGTFFSNSALALRKAACAGLGIAMVPRYSVADDLSDGTLVNLLPRYKIAQRPLLAIYPQAAVIPRKVQVFVDFLVNWMASQDVEGRPARLRQAIPA
jgi:DNA-binding transcriptional LysR family regulator